MIRSAKTCDCCTEEHGIASLWSDTPEWAGRWISLPLEALNATIPVLFSGWDGFSLTLRAGMVSRRFGLGGLVDAIWKRQGRLLDSGLQQRRCVRQFLASWLASAPIRSHLFEKPRLPGAVLAGSRPILFRSANHPHELPGIAPFFYSLFVHGPDDSPESCSCLGNVGVRVGDGADQRRYVHAI